MEKLKAPHDHKLTDILKVLIFTIILLLPGIMFLPSCIYYGFNEHANANITQDTKINLKQMVINGKPINDYQDINYGPNTDEYSINTNNNYYVLVNDYVSFNIGENIEIDDILYCKAELYIENGTSLLEIFITSNNGDTYFTSTGYAEDTTLNFSDYKVSETTFSNAVLQFSSDDQTYIYFKNIQLFNLTEIFGSGNEPTKEEFESYLTLPYYEYGTNYEITISKGYNISDQVGENWSHLWQLPVFNWTNNTPFNNSINGFIGIFGINNTSYISNVLIWIVTITAIYIVFDIIIATFKWLTHLIGGK